MENKKNTVLLTVIAVATLLVAVVGATFAYFSASEATAVSKNVSVITGSGSSSSFAINGAIAVTADLSNFGSGQGDRSSDQTGTVKWTAPGQAEGGTAVPDEQLRFCYTVKVNVTANDFEYTTDGNTPELVLDVTKNSVAVVEAKDITEYTGTIDIPTVKDGTDYTHRLTDTSSTSPVEKTDTWNVKVTLKNLSSDQNGNMGKSLTGTLVFAEATTCPAE